MGDHAWGRGKRAADTARPWGAHCFCVCTKWQNRINGTFGDASPIASFLARNENGGMHHICYEVDDIDKARNSLQAAGARVLGDGTAKIGAHGNPVLFLHPKDFNGTLIELEQVTATVESPRAE